MKRLLLPRIPRIPVLSLLAFVLSGCFVGDVLVRNTAALVQPAQKSEKPKHVVRSDARLAVTWVGHATALVQMDDKFVMTDPVFTSSVGQISSRLVEPGIDIADVPPLDAVVISHMHYDHLSLGTLQLLEPNVRSMAMPYGGIAYLTDFQFPVNELLPWQSVERNGLRITAVPVDHVGHRYAVDKPWMKTSFTGYVVEYHGLTVYFPGDTAYDGTRFAAVRERFPKIDVALLPIAPIEPRDFMRHTHLDPAEAVQAFFDLGAATMVPIHFDTFINGGDRPGAAPALLREIAHKAGIADRVFILKQGGQKVIVPKAAQSHSKSNASAQ